MNTNHKLLGLLIASLLGGTATAADLESVRVFNIKPQKLESALIEFSKQADMQVIGATTTFADTVTQGVSGEISSRAALNALLQNTSVIFNPIGTHSVQIVPSHDRSTSQNVANPLRALLAQTEDLSGSDQRAEVGSGGSSTEGLEGRLEEIVVTAQKREERLVDVPLSMTVVSGESLDGSTVGMGEHLNRIPGVNNVVSGETVRKGLSVGNIIIRGVAPLTGGPTSAYYLESLPTGPVESDTYDLSRIEVVRGPQGTLYGANAFNGVVRVLTQAPNLDDFELKARTAVSSTEGGEESYRGDLAVNVPIIDRQLAVRAVIGHQYRGGWLDQPNDDDANSTEVDSYRVRIRAQPTERLTVDGLAWIYRGLQNAQSNSPDGRTNPSVVDEFVVNEFDLFGLTVGYDFDEFRFTSATSRMEYRNDGRFDYRPWLSAPVFNNFKFDSPKVFSQEFGLVSTGKGDWRWSLGAIYNESEGYVSLLRTNSTTGALQPPFAAPSINGGSNESYAVFGELTRLLFDGRLELTAGGRYFHDEAESHEISNLFFSGGIPPGGLSAPSTGEWKHVAPRFVATWHPSEDSSLYASYGQGFRSGIIQTAAARSNGFSDAEPDTLTNYEIGYKGSSWDGRVNVEAAVFYMDWQDVQQATFFFLVPPNPNIPGDQGVFAGANLNTGSATGLGVEGGISAEVVDGLMLSASFSWNGLELDQDVFNAQRFRTYRKGDRILGSPEYTIAAGLDYSFALGGSGLDGRFSTGASYLPEYVSAITDPSAATISSYQEAVLNLRASFAVEAGHWTASLYGENLANESGTSQDPFRSRTRLPDGTVAAVWNTWMRPRTFGVQLEYRF